MKYDFQDNEGTELFNTLTQIIFRSEYLLMLSQEIIYQHLKAKQYTEVITLLHENGNKLDGDPNVEYAIRIFMDEFFGYVKTAGSDVLKELNQDLDILFLSHTTEKYLLNNAHLLQLIHLLHGRTPLDLLYEVAKIFSDDLLCQEIIEVYEAQSKLAEAERLKPYRPEPFAIRTPLSGQKYETEIKHKENISWVKVYLRSNELLNIVAKHISKLPSVEKANITTRDNGHSNLTIYAQRPFTIEETHDEVELTLENYFSRSPSDPIFKEEVISGISDIAYFQILDYMLKLGVGLESFRSLSAKMDEERYRDYFVSYLDSLSNNHTATGETFHGVGKTDILIRNQAKEVLLVAECKLWGGQVHLNKAIDQLFTRYIAWRDGKAALLIFNTKAVGFSKIVDIAVTTLKSHPLCISYEGQRSETSFSYIFRNHQDPAKSIKLELIMFNFV